MKSKTLLLVIISVFLLMMIPHVNAIEYREVTEIFNHQYQKSIQAMYSHVSDNFIKKFIDLLIEIVIFIFDIIDNILAFIAIIFLGWGHRDPGLFYYFTYLLHLINLFIAQSLIHILNFISSLFDDAIEKRLYDKLMASENL